jgi:F0F1-type ATP synthase assembly protein I
VPGERDRSSLAEAMRKAGPYLNLGWTFAASLAGGALLGAWLDRKFQTRPWLLLAGCLLGMAAGFTAFFRVVLPRPGGPGKGGPEGGDRWAGKRD